MIEKLDRLYELLPTVHRVRDDAMGEPLRALLQVITEQADLLEQDMQRLYDNWFIETCEPWVVPYIADLVGHQAIDDSSAAAEDGSAAARNAALLPRREIANTLRYRRRKGTLALLELLAADVSGWSAKAVEFNRLLRQATSLRLLGPMRGRSMDLRDGAALERLNLPGGAAFGGSAHSTDLRRLISKRSVGRYSPPSLGIFVWRLKACPITKAPAVQQDAGANFYTFSVLGNDAPLFNTARPQACPDSIAEATNLPHALGRREFAAPRARDAAFATASPEYYGMSQVEADRTRVARSLAVWAVGWGGGLPTAAQDVAPIPDNRIIAADLTDWRYLPPEGFVAVDPVLGRIAFPQGHAPAQGEVVVSYHHGAVADLGGGEYIRRMEQHPDSTTDPVTNEDELRRALRPWTKNAGGGRLAQPAHWVIEIANSGVYDAPIQVWLGEGHSLQIRAKQGTRPVLRLAGGSDSFAVQGEKGSRFTLDGLLVVGCAVNVGGDLASFTVRHSTLVPGRELRSNGDPRHRAKPSIIATGGVTCIVIEHSIVGPIRLIDVVRLRGDSGGKGKPAQPIELRISDSVVDTAAQGAAGSKLAANGDDPEAVVFPAIGGGTARYAYAQATIVRSTVLGRVRLHSLSLGENSIFYGRVEVARRQLGCVRFCWVPISSRTPTRFHCQPELTDALVGQQERGREAGDVEISALRAVERRRVTPQFDSARYGTPTYCRLALDCAAEIVRGADDESEMGVYHHLYQPQRSANLATRVDEYSPAAADVGLIFAD